MNFSVTILGNGSAVPTKTQNPASQLLQYNGQKYLIDCGEGTQMQMIRFGIGHKNLNHIFISHLHGDHFFGLIGLISTFHLYGRQIPLHVYGPKALEQIINIQLKASDTRLIYQLVFHSIEKQGDFLFENKTLEIQAFPVRHRIKTWGFIFNEKVKPRKLKKTFVETYRPGIAAMQNIKKGANFITNSRKILINSEITTPPASPLKYAYSSDTAYFEKIISFVERADLLYHESTFDNSMAGIASEKFHSTAAQAATIAKKAGVKKLLLGHYSARFSENFDTLLKEARIVFPKTILSVQGETYNIG